MSEIFGLIPKVMEEIGAIGKNRKNEQQRYSFRGIEDFYQAAHPALIKHGVFCAPKVLEREEYRFDKTNDQGRVTSWLHVTLKVEHRFYASDGSYIEVVTCGEGLDNSDKATNKAMSGAMKYALIELFCVPTQDVEDSDRTSPETGLRHSPVSRTTEPIDLGGRGNDAAVNPEKSDVASKTEGESGRPPSPVVEYCTKGEAVNFERTFKDICVDNGFSATEALLHAHKWLFDGGYVGPDGAPSAKYIPRATFEQVKASAKTFAKGLKK